MQRYARFDFLLQAPFGLMPLVDHDSLVEMEVYKLARELKTVLVLEYVMCVPVPLQ